MALPYLNLKWVASRSRSTPIPGHIYGLPSQHSIVFPRDYSAMSPLAFGATDYNRIRGDATLSARGVVNSLKRLVYDDILLASEYDVSSSIYPALNYRQTRNRNVQGTLDHYTRYAASTKILYKGSRRY